MPSSYGVKSQDQFSVGGVKREGSCPARCNKVTLAVKTHLVIVRFGFQQVKSRARLHRWNDQIEVLKRGILDNPGRG